MKKTCFVIIGYGIKTDYKTGRDIDLDKTYRTIIEPVFQELGFLCFRASDIKHSGNIDLHMYENILKADFVIADITTLNPNVLYELGVRHAVRKNTTLIIAENELEYPFDLGHIVIDSYEHLGKSIDYEEVLRFRALLLEKVVSLLDSPVVDSPLYTVIPNLINPQFTEEEVIEIEESIEDEKSLSDIINSAEEAKRAKDYYKAKELFREAIILSNNDPFLIQRLSLITYKSKEPDEKSALFEAEKILGVLNPEKTNDPETLGLSGAINKRLFEIYEKPDYLEKALWFYERGYYVKRDYYNGINAAFLHTVMSTIEDDLIEAAANYGQGRRIRRKVLEICQELENSKEFNNREDKAWIYATMAEAHFGLDDYEEEKKYVELMKEYGDAFVLDAYATQNKKLKNLIELFNKRQNK